MAGGSSGKSNLTPEQIEAIEKDLGVNLDASLTDNLFIGAMVFFCIGAILHYVFHWPR